MKNYRDAHVANKHGVTSVPTTNADLGIYGKSLELATILVFEI